MDKNKWTHIALSRNNKKYTMYIDGIPQNPLYKKWYYTIKFWIRNKTRDFKLKRSLKHWDRFVDKNGIEWIEDKDRVFGEKSMYLDGDCDYIQSKLDDIDWSRDCPDFTLEGWVGDKMTLHIKDNESKE